MFQTIRVLPLFVALAWPATSASACAVCFGNTGGSWISGFTWGVAFLVVLPFLMVAGFVAWIALSARKNARRASSASVH